MELEDEYEFSGTELDHRAEIIFRLARIHYHLYLIEHPQDKGIVTLQYQNFTLSRLWTPIGLPNSWLLICANGV